jgi:hypothetical protein
VHPRAFIDGYWRNDLRNEVFVAMSFDVRFNQRWEEIFLPAIESEPIGGVQLKAVRVDIRRAGESILTEIADGIAHAQLVLADVSITERWTSDGNALNARNGNVMYEVGLALAWRQPAEVLLVRDDDDRLLFDIGHIPVAKFDPSDSSASAEGIRAGLNDRWRERQLVKDFRVARTLETLSPFEINVILTNAHLKAFGWPAGSLPAAVAMALPTLLEKRVVRLLKHGGTGGQHVYGWTTFGSVIAGMLSQAQVGEL